MSDSKSGSIDQKSKDKDTLKQEKAKTKVLKAALKEERKSKEQIQESLSAAQA